MNIISFFFPDQKLKTPRQLEYSLSADFQQMFLPVPSPASTCSVVQGLHCHLEKHCKGAAPRWRIPTCAQAAAICGWLCQICSPLISIFRRVYHLGYIFLVLIYLLLVLLCLPVRPSSWLSVKHHTLKQKIF